MAGSPATLRRYCWKACEYLPRSSTRPTSSPAWGSPTLTARRAVIAETDSRCSSTLCQRLESEPFGSGHNSS